MDRSTRRSLVAAYKERPTVAGVFAVICTATGEVWVGQSQHIDTHQNGLWFGLRLGSSPFGALQRAWNLHSPEDFRFEQLDRLPEDLSPMRRKDELKARAALWRERLGAPAL